MPLWISRFVRYRGAASVLLALLTAIVNESSRAADGDDDDTPTKPTQHVAFQASTELTTRRDFSGTASVAAAPFGGLDDGGVRLVLEGTGSLYHYTDSNPSWQSILGRSVQSDAFVGYEIDRDKLTAAAYVGFDSQTNTESIFDPANSTVGTKTGVGLRLEVSYDADDIASLEGMLDLDSANRAWRLDLKATRPIYMGLSAGPELIGQGDSFYRQIGGGAYVQGLSFYGVAVGWGGGFVVDAREGPGAYFTIDTEKRF